MPRRREPQNQLAIDIEGLIHEAQVAAAAPWTGAPLHFTTRYYSPTELDAAFEHWQFLHGLSNSHAASRRWHRAIAVSGSFEVGAHRFDLYGVDLRCDPWKHPRPDDGCSCVGDLTYQAICEPCGWHDLREGENAAVEGWHDHALPGWRDLPIVPAGLRDRHKIGLSKAARSWIAEHYPESMQVAGAPIITKRDTGTRHVPGRSPWGGYDLSHTAIDPGRKAELPKPRRRRTPAKPLEERRISPRCSGIGLDD